MMLLQRYKNSEKKDMEITLPHADKKLSCIIYCRHVLWDIMPVILVFSDI